MSTASIKRSIIGLTGSLLIAVPMPVMAAVNQTPQAAAAAGLQYLAAQQKIDGSISGFGGESEWAVEAVEASSQSATTFAHGGASLLDFVKTDAPAPSATATALERDIISIKAAGADSTSFGGVNYDTQLASRHIDGQIGDATLLNDDIFGIIAIDATHDSSLKPMAQDGLDYLLAHQAADGGFSYSTDTCAWCGSDSNDTAATIVALYAAEDLGLSPSKPGVSLATIKSSALAYLLSTQGSDGGFGYDGFSSADGSSTAWGLMALNTIGDAVQPQALQARNWLLKNQNADGGFSYAAYGYTDSDTSTTAHAIIALQGTTWLLRPAPFGSSSSSSQPVATNSSISSQPQATSTNSGGTTPVAQTPKTKLATNAAPTDDSTLVTQSDTTDSNPQVKGASISYQPKTSTHNPITLKTDKSRTSYAVYAAALLGLVALSWFVLESRKSKGVN